MIAAIPEMFVFRGNSASSELAFVSVNIGSVDVAVLGHGIGAEHSQ